jgi:probable rRNA maturation factor
VVSYPTAVAQAAEMGHSIEEELTLLVVHGCLHLLGYEDSTEEERCRMWARQEELLQMLR